MRPYSSLASSFGSSACGPIGLSCGAGDYSAASIAALSCSLGASAGSGVLSMGSMGLLARACSRGGVWLDGGRRATATLMLAAGAQVLATPALAQTCTNWQNGGTLPGTGVKHVDGICVNGTVVSNGGVQDVFNGGVASGTVVSNGGEQNVYNNGVASGTVVSDGGVQDVYGGGVASGTVVSNGGVQDVYGGGVASGTVVSNGGGQDVWNGGGASGTVVSNGGRQKVFNGGTAEETIVSNGGYQGLGEGKFDNITGEYQGVLSKGGKATNTTIHGEQYIFDGGVDDGAQVFAYGEQHIYSGGVASNTILHTGGVQSIFMGGVASGVQLLSSGVQVIGSSGVASGTVINEEGAQEIKDGGVASGTTINKEGAQYVSNGGAASATTVKEGGAQYVSAGGAASATTVKEGGAQHVASDGSAQDTMLEGGTMHISSGGILVGSPGGYGTVDNKAPLIVDGTPNGFRDITASGGSAGAEKTLVISRRVEVSRSGHIRAFAHTTLRMADGETIVGWNGGAGTLRLEGGTIEAGRIEAGALSANDNSANTLRTSGVNAGGNDGVIISGGYVSAGHVTVEGAFFAVSGGASTATVNIAKGKVTGDFRVDSGSGNLGTTEIEGDAELDLAILTGGVYKKNMKLGRLSEIRNAAVGGDVTVSAYTNDAKVTATSGGTMTVGGTIDDAVAVTVQENGNMAVGQLASGTDMANFTVHSGGVLALGATGQTQADFTRLRSHASGGGVVALQGLNAPGATIAPAGAANTLAVDAASTVASIGSFENLHFILSSALTAGGVALTIAGGAPTVFAQMTKIGVAVAGGGSVLKMGDQVTLLTNAAGLENSTGGTLQQGTDYQQVNITGRQGISLDYGFALDNDVNSIFAKVTTVPKPKPTPQPQPDPKPQPQPTPPQPVPPQPTPPGPQVNPQTKAVVEGRVAGMGMLNLGVDQIVRMTGNLPNRTGGGGGVFDRSGGPLSKGANGTNGAGGGNANGAGAPSDTTAFAQLSGYDQKAETGSHVKVNGASAIVGAAKVLPLAGGGTAAVGAFFEYGDGTFKTHNGFDTGDVNGKGNSDYYGAGVLARVNLAGGESADGGGAPFVEGSLHAGRIHNNWHTDDLRDAATGARAQYDIRTPYMGGHVGAGYRWQTNDTTQMEVFGQYLYTHMDGKDTTVALDPYHFKAVKSSRTRIGAKGTWAVSQQTQAYAGAAWEREFDGTARATAYSFDVPAPTMKGNSAVLDAGLTFQPKRNLSTNVGVTGYAGKRKGVAANVEVQYLF